MPYLYSKDTDGSHYYIYPETLVVAFKDGDYVYVLTTCCKKVNVKCSLKFVREWMTKRGIHIVEISRDKIGSHLYVAGATTEDKVIFRPQFINSIPADCRPLFENHSMQAASKNRMRKGSANYKKSKEKPESSSTIKTGDSTVRTEPSAIKKDVSTVKKKRNDSKKR